MLDFVKLFGEIIADMGTYTEVYPSRKLKETDYFFAYITFLRNSIYYSRFTYVIRGVEIKGKHLHNKVMRWKKDNIFLTMYKNVLSEYIGVDTLKKTRYLTIDSQFIPNKYCCTPKIKKNKYYSRKKGLRLTSIVDANGISLSCVLTSGEGTDIDKLTQAFDELLVETNSHKYRNSRKLKRIVLAERKSKGYDSAYNREYLADKGYKVIIPHNRRNARNTNTLNRYKLTAADKKHLSKRHMVENSYAWKNINFPRLERMYDQNEINYLNAIYLHNIWIIYNRKTKL